MIRVRVETVWAAVEVDPNGDENVVGFVGPMGVMPLIGSRKEHVRALAQRIADQDPGRKFRLLRYKLEAEEAVITRGGRA